MRNQAPQDLFIPAPKLNQLHILQQIGAKPDVTQAEMAEHCALSVAMVNNYMKELCTLGFIEYRRKNSKSVSYHLTDAGKEAIEEIQGILLQELSRFFARAKERVLESIVTQARGNLRQVVLFGTGELAEVVLHALESVKISIVAVCSNDPAEIGLDWYGMKVIQPVQVRYLDPDAVIIALPNKTEEVYRELSRTCSSHTELITVGFRAPQMMGMPNGVGAHTDLSAATVR